MTLRRAPSRLIDRPKIQSEYTSDLYVLLGFAAVLSPLLVFWPISATWWITVTLATMVCLILPFEYRRIRIKQARKEVAYREGICRFARCFDCRQTDTRIIRAVYEVFACELNQPVSATDHLADDLKMDCCELWECMLEISERCPLSLERLEENPLYGSVNTVGDIVRLLEKQPLLDAA